MPILFHNSMKINECQLTEKVNTIMVTRNDIPQALVIISDQHVSRYKHTMHWIRHYH